MMDRPRRLVFVSMLIVAIVVAVRTVREGGTNVLTTAQRLFRAMLGVMVAWLLLSILGAFAPRLAAGLAVIAALSASLASGEQVTNALAATIATRDEQTGGSVRRFRN